LGRAIDRGRFRLTGREITGIHGVQSRGLGLGKGVAERDFIRTGWYVDLAGNWDDAGAERDVGRQTGHYY
jgi:hypothetical protein